MMHNAVAGMVDHFILVCQVKCRWLCERRRLGDASHGEVRVDIGPHHHDKFSGIGRYQSQFGMVDRRLSRPASHLLSCF